MIRFWPLLAVAIAVGLLGLRACTHETQLERLVPAASEPGDPPGTRAYRGYLHVPRGGPVVLGFQSTAPSRLSAGLATGTAALAGPGLRKQRLLVDAGPLAIRFAAAPDARLVWNPVGRRGDPEYVPPGVLAPTEAHVPTDAFPADGAIALSLLAVLVGSILIAQRRRLALVPRATWIAMAAVFAAALLVRLIDLGGAGQTWDEDVNWAAGRNYVQNVLAGDMSARSWTWNYEHPPVMKLLAGIGAQLSSGFGPARAISAILVALGCALLVPIGKRLFDLRTGIVAAGIAALLPPLVAHGQVVGHEAPTVLWWSLGILLALCVHDDLASAPPEASIDRRTLILRLAGVGAVIGIAVASRFVNGLLGPLCVLIVLVKAPDAWRRATLIWTPVMIAATLLAFYAVWPRLWADPIGALQLSLAKLDNPHAPEPFLGAVTNRPPPYYFAIYLVATLPLGALLAALAGAVRGVIENSRSTAIVVAWLAIPLFVAASPIRQDGVRYVMPSILALAVLAASGVTFLAARIRWRHTFTVATAALGLYLALVLVRVHPYYLDYYGEHVGGPSTVAARRWFETAWWGEGLDRAIAYVNAHAPINASVDRSCVLPSHLTWFRADLWSRMAATPASAEWIVEYIGPRGCNVPAGARVVFEVDAAGAPLARVWRR